MGPVISIPRGWLTRDSRETSSAARPKPPRSLRARSVRVDVEFQSGILSSGMSRLISRREMRTGARSVALRWVRPGRAVTASKRRFADLSSAYLPS